jgi:colicin import membrane protein
MAITKEQIFNAADQILASGQRPTLESIRQTIGGSYTTISPALNEWKNRQKASAGPLREPAPQVVGDRLTEFGSEIWAIALELANTRLASEREALEQARTDMEAAQAEATELADRLAGEVEDLQTRCAELTDRASASDRDATELRGQLTAAQEQARTAEARAVEIQQRADDLKGALTAAQEQARVVSLELETEHERHQQEAEQLRGKLSEQQELAAATLTKAQADHEQTRAELAAVRTELVKTQAKAEAAEQAHSDQRKQMTERLTANQAELDEARKAASVAREEAARLAGQLAVHQEQTAAILARLAPADNQGVAQSKNKTTDKNKGA